MAKRKYTVGGKSMRCRPIEQVPEFCRELEAKRRELDIPQKSLCALAGTYPTYWDVLMRSNVSPDDWEEKRSAFEFAIDKVQAAIRGE